MLKPKGSALSCATLLSCVLITGARATAQENTPTPPRFTLSEALSIAYETNPQLAAARAGLRATDEDVATANAGWRPQISATGTYNVAQYKYLDTIKDQNSGAITRTPTTINTHPLEGQLGITQPIFRGGQTYAEIGKAKANVRAGRANLIATEQTVLLAAVTSYMDVVRDTAIVNLRRQNIATLRKARDGTALEFKAGSLTRTDVAQSEARLAAAEAGLTAAEGQLAISHAGFLQTIGRPAESLEETPLMPPLPKSETEAADIAGKANPALLEAREHERAASYAVDSAIGAMLPNLSVTGGYSYSQGSQTSALGTGMVVHGLGVSGTLNVPIYQGGAEHAAVRKAKELHAQADLSISMTDRQVRQTVASAWHSYLAAEASIASNVATAKADEIAFTGVGKERRAGGRTILDLLNAQQELLNAQVAVVSARRDTVVAAYQLLSAEGQLTAQGLRLNAKLYDPRAHYDEDAAAWVGF